MPLLYVDLIEGRQPTEIRSVLDALHDAVVEAFGVPERDRRSQSNPEPGQRLNSRRLIRRQRVRFGSRVPHTG